MSASALRVRRWVGRHWGRLVVAAVLIGVVGGLALGLAAGTRRTSSAPDRYTRHFGGDPDLLITQLSGQPLDEQVARLPGVASIESFVFVPSFPVSPRDGTPVLEPNTFAGDDDAVGRRAVQGRLTDPSHPDEFTVNRSMASLLSERFGTRIGDRFQVVSYDQDQVAANFDTSEDPAVPAFTATLVGVTDAPSDFDDDSPMMVFPRSFIGRHPDVGVVQTIMAVHLAPGADPGEVMQGVHQLPNGSDAYAGAQRVVSDSARRAVRFQVTALWVVAALSVLAAAVLIAQVVSRTLRVGDEERASMAAIGWRRRDLAVERAVEGGIAAIIATPVAGLVAYALTSMFPLGVLRSIEPDPGAHVDWFVTVVGLVGLGGFVVATAAVVGIRRTRLANARGRPGVLTSALSPRGARMPLAVGARFASSGIGARGRPWASLLAGAIGVAGVVGAVCVGLSLTRIIDRPDRWGVDYDQLFGNPYTSTQADIVAPVVGNPDVVGLMGATIGSVSVDGADTPTLAFTTAKGGLVPTVLRGRSPAGSGEIGLGAEVARRLGVGLGDTVEVAGVSGSSRPLAVVGIVVTPDSAGAGAAMSFDAYHELNPSATQNLVLVDFRQGAPVGARRALAAANFSPPGALPVPTSVRALGRVTAAPFLLAAVLALLLVVGCTYLLASSVRARRGDLAILRALGSNSRQLRTAVHWQATLVTAAIVVIGVPLGVSLGRRVVSLLTTALGIVPGTQQPAAVLLLVTIGALLIANGLAFLPARRAARARIAQLSLDR
jgi:ABC-type lipoprotein release transport system permease subunit